MGKVRVYELAKELGIESKVLTAKLIEMGYQVKAYNSTLDDATAEDIREKLRDDQAVTETIMKDQSVEEKRIQRKGGATIIRRRTKQAPEAEIVEEIEPTPESLEVPAEVAEPAAPQPGVEVEAEAEVEPEAEIEAEEPVPALKTTPVEEEVGAEGAQAAQAEETPSEEEVRPEAEEESVAAAEEAPAPEQPEAPRKKGLARVIKRAAIAIPTEEKPQVRKTEKPRRKPAAEPEKVVRPAKPAAEEAPKGKKGKRFVQFQHDAGPRDRAKKALSKRKGQVDLDIDEVQELGGNLPIAGLKVGGRGRRTIPKKKKTETSQEAAETRAIKRRIKVYETISVGDLAHRMGTKASEVIAKLMGLGVMATVNQALDVDTASLVGTEFGYEVEAGVTEEQNILSLEDKESGGEMMPRPPVVTVMGHVDHGKTSILDAIRKTDVAAGEAGGITQHIGAHHVRSARGEVVFLDTPGHAAFTEMRARGAKVTDVVVLVVAADDGVMDQTKEAISHARAAQVPIVVAVNKIDKPDADVMRVKRELSEQGLMPEEWGGDVIYCETSAKQNVGIESLLENILLQAEFQELKADPKRRARGWVIEAQLHKGRGPVATVLVQQGTLRVGEVVVIGQHYGKIRSLTNDKGARIEEAGPSTPVEIQGLSGVPQAGDEFVVVPDEKMAKNVSTQRQLKVREAELATTSKISLENLFEKMKEDEVKELMVVLRADVQGTLEAFAEALTNLSTDQIRVRVLHQGTGTITESDVLLAAASDALIIGFNVRPSSKVQELAKKEKVDLRSYDVIYHALEDIKNAMVGMLEPTYVENVIGLAEVRETFTVPKVGTIAGSYVLNGKMERNAHVRVLRDGVVVYTGRLSSLKRFKDDAKEVQTGYECGIGVENFNDIKVGDQLEAFVMEEVAGVL